MHYEDIINVKFWEEQWAEAKRSAFLSKSQSVKPESWLDFFDSISDIYLKIWGNGDYFGKTAVNTLVAENLINKESNVLDAGCGPGTLAIPMAAHTAKVTGMDYSPAMLNILKKEALKHNIFNIETVCTSFENYSPDTKYDLVTASFVPPSLNPDGIRKMESWTKGYCAVMVGAGINSQKIPNILWNEVMDRASPVSGIHLVYLMGYLISSGRMPNIKHISNSYLFRCPVEDMVRFYTAYFDMFIDREETDSDSADNIDNRKSRNIIAIENKLRNALNRFIKDGSVEYEEEMNTCIVWWKKP